MYLRSLLFSFSSYRSFLALFYLVCGCIYAVLIQILSPKDTLQDRGPKHIACAKPQRGNTLILAGMQIISVQR